MSWINDLLVPVAFKPKRRIGSFYATVTLEESATDELTITQHPVQRGAAITDHAYKNPVTLNITCQSKRVGTETVSQMYRNLRELQSSAIPMNVVTGKRIYTNMLIQSLSETTDVTTGDILNLSLSLVEVIIVGVVTVTGVPDAENQANPEQTNATEKTGTKQATEPSSAVSAPVAEQATQYESLLSKALGS